MLNGIEEKAGVDFAALVTDEDARKERKNRPLLTEDSNQVTAFCFFAVVCSDASS